MVLAVFDGAKRTGGFSVKIEKVIVHKNGKKGHVLVRRTQPKRDGMVTQSITYPHHVVVVPRFAGKLSFIDAESDEGKQLAAETTEQK